MAVRDKGNHVEYSRLDECGYGFSVDLLTTCGR